MGDRESTTPGLTTRLWSQIGLGLNPAFATSGCVWPFWPQFSYFYNRDKDTCFKGGCMQEITTVGQGVGQCYKGFISINSLDLHNNTVRSMLSFSAPSSGQEHLGIPMIQIYHLPKAKYLGNCGDGFEHRQSGSRAHTQPSCCAASYCSMWPRKQQINNSF